MIIDLHTHTRVGSDDSFIEIPDLVRKARESGLDGVCITDHDWFWKRDVVEGYGREQNFLLLPGVEMSTDDGHFLVFGLNKYSFGMHRTANLKAALDEVGGVMVLAHPHRRNLRWDEEVETGVERYSQNPVFGLVDIVETDNGRSNERQNSFSREICSRLGLRATGGSDAHQLTDIPTGATTFERDIHNVQELIEELKEGRFRPADLRKRP